MLLHDRQPDRFLVVGIGFVVEGEQAFDLGLALREQNVSLQGSIQQEIPAALVRLVKDDRRFDDADFVNRRGDHLVFVGTPDAVGYLPER
ncbi:hypothetical protein Q2941_47655 [Bradyrhizobium sp. UFLA05-153]